MKIVIPDSSKSDVEEKKQQMNGRVKKEIPFNKKKNLFY